MTNHTTKPTDVPKEVPLDSLPAEPCFRSVSDLMEIADNLTKQIEALTKRRDQIRDMASYIGTLPTS